MKRLSLLALLLCPLVAHAQRNATIPDSDPEVERKSFIVAPGFEVNLFAADPLLAKPIQMNWDPQGRLWVATSETYPQILPGQKANDKIIILEDTKGVGVADKTTVFADGLLIPTGIEPGDDGAYVANSTELVHLSASKPGGKADKKKVLLSGFGTEDTHHIIHTFRWGPDGCLYFNQSIYIHSHVETPAGVKRLNAGGIWRYNTATNDLSVFARGWVNSWGHAFDKYGQSFTTDGAGGEGINHVVPGGYYLTSSGPHAGRILHGLNPGSPKHCGLEIVSGRHMPDDWQGNLITNDFRGHRVCRFVLSEDGSTYASREMPELIKTTHPAFRPIDVKMGPDGAIYIADWYNPIIQHGEVDFRDPRRDKTHGRIWRVTAKGRPLVPRPKLVGLTPLELITHLKDPEDWTRQQARRLLQEYGHKERDRVITGISTDVSLMNESHSIERLNVLQSLGAQFHYNDLKPLVESSKSANRAYAARIWPQKYITASEQPFPSKEWNQFLDDSSPRVRLEALRTYEQLSRQTAIKAIPINVLDHPMDPTLDYALWLTLRELEPIWLPAFQKGELTFGGDPKKIAFALSAAQSPDAVKPLAKLIDGGTVAKDKVQELCLVMAKIGGPEELASLLKRSAGPSLAPRDQAALIAAVENSARSRKVGSPKDTAVVGTLLKSQHRPVAWAAMKLAGLWKLPQFRDDLEAVAKGNDGLGERTAGIEAVTLYADGRAKSFLTALCDDKERPESGRVALVALAGLDTPLAAKKAATALADISVQPGINELVTAFTSRRGGGAALANALKGQTIPSDSAKLAIARLRSSGANEPALVAALTAAGKLNVAKAYPTETEIKTLAATAMTSGDAARGEAIYRRAELQCLKCHAVAGAGGLVGPDMTSLGASAPADYLVEALLNPNAKVKEGYNAIQVTTLAGKQVQGVKVHEADGVLVLRNAEDKEESIRLDDIDAKKDSRSLMPDGLVDSLTNAELADLVKFLSELGKVGPYAPNPARLVRTWESVDGTGTNTEKFRRARITVAAEKDAGLTWSPAYTKVSGALPLSDVPKYAVWNNTEPQSVIRCHLDVTTPGPVRLKFNDITGLNVFMDGKPTDGKAEFDVTVPTGLVPVTIVVNRDKRTADVTLELIDVPGSPARVKPKNGK